MFWGVTPGINLLKVYQNTKKEELPKEINILITGSSDCRHILLTLSKQHLNTDVNINFYVVETCLEVIARQLLLLIIAFQPHIALGLDQKIKIFMEIYGNILLQPNVAKYLSSAAFELLNMVTNFEYFKEKLPCVKLDITYKERDYLETLLKFWKSKEEFSIVECWNKRLRQFLGVRYDSRIGVFDWDLHIKLHNRGATQICSQEYRNFRNKGLAFSWIDSEVSKPNRSLVCAVLSNGDRFAHYGYLGDMQTGPFIAYGLNCEDNEFLKSRNGQNVYRATDVTQRNLQQLFYEIHNKDEYIHKCSNVHLGSSTIKEEKIVLDNNGFDVIPGTVKKCIDLENVKIIFMSTSKLNTMKLNEKYDNKFDIVYVGSAFLTYIQSDLIKKIAKKGALLLMENQLLVPGNGKKELEDVAKKIREILESIQTKSTNFDPEKDLYAKFILNSYV